MPIDTSAFVAAIQAASKPAEPESDVVDPELQLDQALSAGQIFLSKAEVFSTELVQGAFIGQSGVDLRGPLALKNLETAIALVNWLNTDEVLRQAWALQKELPELLKGVPELRGDDVKDLEGVWAQLEAENPEPQSLSQAKTLYNDRTPPRTITGFPANSYLDPTTQAALRLWTMARLARDFTAVGVDLRAEWWKVAHRRENISRVDFERWFALDLSGIAGYRRGLVYGMGGNFFKDLGRSITRLFKDPRTWLRNVQESIGRGIKAVETPFQWMRDKIPFLGYALGGILPTVIGELGHALEEGSINAYNEQRLVFVTGMHLTVAGTVIAAIGSVVSLFFPPLGAVLVGIGAIAVAVGRAILQFQQMIRQQRLDKLLGKQLITPDLPTQSAAAANAGALQGGGSSSGGGGVIALLALAALALGGRR